jgi:hypothetical protein
VVSSECLRDWRKYSGNVSSRLDGTKETSTEKTLLVQKRAEHLHNSGLARSSHTIKPTNMSWLLLPMKGDWLEGRPVSRPYSLGDLHGWIRLPKCTQVCREQLDWIMVSTMNSEWPEKPLGTDHCLLSKRYPLTPSKYWHYSSLSCRTGMPCMWVIRGSFKLETRYLTVVTSIENVISRTRLSKNLLSSVENTRRVASERANLFSSSDFFSSSALCDHLSVKHYNGDSIKYYLVLTLAGFWPRRESWNTAAPNWAAIDGSARILIG